MDNFMNINFKISKIEYKKIKPYKIKGINIYSIEEALYIFYNNWKEISNEFFEDNFINWVKNQLFDLELYKILLNIKSLESFYEKSILFLKINDFFTKDELDFISNDLIEWEKRDKKERLKVLADRFFYEKSYEKAIKTYKKLLELDLNDYSIYNNLGICYLNIKKFEFAINFFEKSFSLNKKNQNILKNLIQATIFNLDNIKFQKYIYFIDEYHMYYYFLAEFQKNLKNYKKSLSYYVKSYLIKRNDDILLKICDNYIIMKNYNKALNVLSLFKEDFFEILIKKSKIYENLKNYKIAIKYLEKANFYDNDNPIIWLKLSKLYRLRGEYLKAEGVLIKAKTLLNENDIQLLFELAMLKKAQGKFQEYQNIIFKISKIHTQNYRKYSNT